MSGTEYDPKNQNPREFLIAKIMAYHPYDKTEAPFIGQFLELLGNPRCFFRDCFPGHITGSAIVVDQTGRFMLLNHHKLLDKWLGFGGHADGDEDIFRVAIRETNEESGLSKFKLLGNGFIDLDIHPIPENPKRGEPAHFHYDVRFVLQMTEHEKPVASDESVALRWVGFDEIDDLIPQEDEGFHRLIKKISVALSPA